MSNWYEQTTRDNSIGINQSGGRDYIVGHQNNTGVTKQTASVTFSLAKIGNGGNGVLTAKIYNTSVAVQHTSTTQINASDLTTSFTDYTFNFDGAVDCLDTQFVAIHTTGTSSGDNFVLVGTYVTTGETIHVVNGTTTMLTYEDRLVTITISSAGTSGSSLLLPPPYSEVVF